MVTRLTDYTKQFWILRSTDDMDTLGSHNGDEAILIDRNERYVFDEENQIWRQIPMSGSGGGGGGSALPSVTTADNGKVLGVVDGAWAKDSNSVVLSVPSVIQPYLAQAVQGAIQTALQNQTTVTMSRTNIASADVAATLSFINTLHEYVNSGKQVWITLGNDEKTLTISLGPNGYACMLYRPTTYGMLTAYCSTYVTDHGAGIDIHGIFTPAT